MIMIFLGIDNISIPYWLSSADFRDFFNLLDIYLCVLISLPFKNNRYDVVNVKKIFYIAVRIILYIINYILQCLTLNSTRNTEF